jgi:hypothetical protein
MSLEGIRFKSEQLFNHSRKGIFWGVIVNEEEEWFEVRLTHHLKGVVQVPAGKVINVRKSFLLNRVELR